MANKVKFGLKNVHYSVITLVNNVPQYTLPPVHIPGAVNLALSPVGEKVKFAADDMEDYFAENVNNGYDGSLEMALVPDDFRKDVLGDAPDNNGALIENKDATVKRFALLFEFDGDAKKTRHVLYNVLANRPNIEGATRSSTKEPKSETLEIEARPAVDTGDVKAKLEQDKTGYDTFFEGVYVKNAPVNGVAAPAAYTKSSGTDLEITYTTTATTHTIKDILLDGVSVGGLNVTVDTSAKTVTISDTYLDTYDAGNYVITLVFSIGNAVNVPLTITGGA